MHAGKLWMKIVALCSILGMTCALAQTRASCEAYLATVTHAYGGAESVRDAGEGFRSRVSEAEILVHPQDDAVGEEVGAEVHGQRERADEDVGDASHWFP